MLDAKKYAAVIIVVDGRRTRAVVMLRFRRSPHLGNLAQIHMPRRAQFHRAENTVIANGRKKLRQNVAVD